MRIKDIEKAFEKRARSRPLHYEIRPAATATELDATECRLGFIFPPALREFYGACNGLLVDTTPVDIFPLDRIERQPGSHLFLFARVYGAHNLCFDASKLNDAGQWSIIFARDRHVVTKTIGSFLANKLWGFIDSSGSDWLKSVLALRDCGPVQAQLVWVFNGHGLLASGIFAKRETADAWIAKNRLSGMLTEAPLDYGSYEHAVRNGLFTPKSSDEVTPEFIGRFSGILGHCHYEDGHPKGEHQRDIDVPEAAVQQGHAPDGAARRG